MCPGKNLEKFLSNSHGLSFMTDHFHALERYMCISNEVLQPDQEIIRTSEVPVPTT